ncbi:MULTISPECIES: spore gernimation protein GerPD [unclassified Bacillus (in: firmicutes)]|jgi:spore germination protein PD|uniref:spore gernimation protein GerPD n=1 Tax=unclassified Bacillus (in: firmicutes) TaxID=185979 RepID=UPI001BE5F360|nr:MULTISPECIES: spore gernimation protein GerPD [unclassified Bacillus (in: firmicutes)]MBT2638926.1 spore gernimation protein GerPD [Bacillus sp. ISL-39]MBT2640619.1 spore gernimation protein GerPD [Bacillus sp. ISL-41]MBT2659936.1 spore gernimation protein GerPD [Bacillus sp. ISL-45]
MNFQVYNRDICVGDIRIIGVSSSSLLMVGDADTIQLAATFDTPAESLIVGPFVPLSPDIS